ncbi:MAG TPA: ubiquinol-cytochrome c reductase cytochrome b subunit [Acidimicrobiales bacterium]|nr:ubiquinol-cytochrome c reductase cytochrome b subunit [Acidimicrobiales bacterium]
MGAVIKRVNRWFDQRLGASGFVRTALNKVFPDHWSFMLGEIALYAFLVLLVTGVYLTFFFEPSVKQVVYHGPYHPLRGVEMSQAYASTLKLSFEVRAGMVMRQMHHWAAIVFLAAIVVHVGRVFFTGAFRRPREINWIVGCTLMVLAMANGFAGYSLPDDQLSGTGLRIAYSIALSIPFAGTWLAYLLFGGEFPAESIITRLFVLHVLLIPAIIAVLLTAHMAIVWRQKHTQFRGPGKTEDNVVGSRLWPSYALKSTGFFFLVSGVIALLGGIAQINPIWLYGPFKPADVSAASQPDWYVGWLDGALRVFPGWEVRAFGHTLPAVFFPGVLMPTLSFALLYGWPFLEARFTKENDRERHLLDRPRERPVRTGIGVAVVAFYTLLFLAAGSDVLATVFKISVTGLLVLFRVLLLTLPPLLGVVTYRLCREAAAVPDEHEGPPLVVRTASGGYHISEEDHDGNGAAVPSPGDGPPWPPVSDLPPTEGGGARTRSRRRWRAR